MFFINNMIRSRFILFGLCILCSLLTQGQNTPIDLKAIEPNITKQVKFLPYLAVRHGGPEGLETWKKDHTVQYYKELWYYCESFYVKRNHFIEGVTLNEEIIDISRFESSRLDDQEALVVLPGFKDVLILLPANKLVYKP